MTGLPQDKKDLSPGNGDVMPLHAAPSDIRIDESFLRAFVSPLAIRPVEAAEETFGAVVQVDIGGFTRAVQDYSREGSVALEAVANLIGGCFNVLVETVTQYGGLVHTFPGDGAIAVWEAPEEGLYDVIGSACECARALAGSFPTPQRFPLKSGVGAGPLRIIALGAQGSRREILLTGPAMADAATALRHANHGQTILSEQAQRLAPRKPRGSAVRPQGNTAMRSPLMNIAAGIIPGAMDAAGMLDYMPRVVRERLQAGLRGWMGEFRHVSTLFLEIGSGAQMSVAAAHEAYALVQRCMAEYDGTIVQFCHDDKGLVCVMAFGVETTHEDDAARALRAAGDLHDGLAAQGVASGVGVTTDRVFSGLLGGEARMEFRLIGTAVNLAARLMASHQGVLCDDTTRAHARSFSFGAPLTLHDRKGRLVAQQPHLRIDATSAIPERFRNGGIADRTCGRTVEIATAEAWLRTVQGGASTSERILAFLGEAGIGKTQLSSQLAQRGQAEGFRVIVCQNEEAAPSIALRAFRPALEQLLDLGDLPIEVRRRLLSEAVVAATGNADLAPLLEDVCPLGMADNATTASMSGASRADNRLALLARLFQAAARTGALQGSPTLVFLEDAHWMDASSWTLLNVLCATPDVPLHFVLTLRAVPGDVATAAALISSERTALIRLGPLDSAHTAELIAARMGAAQATPQLTATVYRRAEGNPLFCREIVRSLAEQSLIVVEAGTARLAGDIDDITEVVPESVEKVLQARLDRLPAVQQWVLKCASVIGVRFDPALLASMPPLAACNDLPSALARLVDADLLDRQGEGRCPLHAFRHSTIRDVAYATLLHEQRRDLHAKMALLLEANPVAGESTLAIFAHWRAANESWRALRYVEPGGDAALREGDYHAAREFFLFGVQTLTGMRDGSSDPRLARWHQQLGEVLVALGRHAQASVQLDSALRLLGEAVPRHRISAVALTVLELVRQVRIRRYTGNASKDAAHDSLRHRAAIHEQLGYVFYASGDTLRGVHAALAMLNRAERAALAPVRARAYAAMSLTVSVTPMRRFADFYENAARRAAEQLGDHAVAAWVEWIASLRAAGEGRWQALFDETARAIDTARQTADPRLVVMGSLTRAWALRLQGELGEARQLARGALQLAHDHGNHLWEAWALLIEAECDLARHAYEAVIKSSQRALDILVEESDRTEEIRAGGLLAAALFAQGQETKALRAAETTISAMRAVDLTSFVMLEGFAGIAEVYVCRCERTPADASGRVRRDLRRAARVACAELARFARVFSVARPRALQLRGRLLFALGRRRDAETALRRAVQEADNLGMPRERILLSRILAERGILITGVSTPRTSAGGPPGGSKDSGSN